MTKETSLEKWLIDRGYTPQQAELWCEFISDSFDLLHDGHDLLCESVEWAAFLAGCHTGKPTEPEITSGLGDRMKRLQSEAPMESNRDRLHVGYEVATMGDHSHGIRKTKSDFEIRRKFEAGYTASFVIEAKPLNIPSDLSNRYLGDEGIGCFLEKNPPYSRDNIVGMIGYAFKDYAKWHKLLRHGIKTIKPLSTLTEISLQNGKRCHVSEHHRRKLDLPDVTVTHTILDYT